MKKEYGGWMLSAFGLLAKLKFLRGTAFDPFGRTAERQTERKLVEDYFAMIDQRVAGLKRGANPAAGEDRAHPRDHPRLRPCQGREHQEGGRREGTAGRRSRKQPVCGCGGVAFPFPVVAKVA